jgi:hypothetical protein
MSIGLYLGVIVIMGIDRIIHLRYHIAVLCMPEKNIKTSS